MNGIILVDKPQDWTSHDVVAKLRGALHERRIGHSGTLDPLATGLLVVFVGRATRAVEFAEADSKEYVAGLRLGVTTDTQDITGNILSVSNSAPAKNEVEAVIRSFKGEIEQIPPMYSAIKVKGRKLYELARRGESVERKPRRITISDIEIIGKANEDYLLRIKCSKGTYVRTICNDIGDILGCGACMSSLRRTRAGVFPVDDAHTVSDIVTAAENGKCEELMLPLDTLFSSFERLDADDNAAKRLKTGNIISVLSQNGRYRVYSPEGEFLLIGEVKGGKLKTIKSFFEV